MNIEGRTTMKKRFDELDAKRAEVLERGRQAAALTIPSLLPRLGYNEMSGLPTPWQGLGARGSNNLASKMLLALLPPNDPFYRIRVDEASLEEISNDPQLKTKVENAIQAIERRIMDEIEAKALRVQIFEALKYLVVVGNALLFLDDIDGARVYRLDQYVVQRDPLGHVLEIVTRDRVSPILLPKSGFDRSKKDPQKPDEMVDVYTRVIRTRDKWEVAQEFDGVIMEETVGSYPLDASPWIPLRWTSVNGENYGRGLVEEYLGDLRSLDVIMQAIVEGSAAAAKVLFLTNPNGLTDPKKLAAATNCDFVPGNAEDITTLQLNKFADFRVALDTVRILTERLEAAFMLNSSVQRQAERVTAEEIRFVARELEDTLGGVYTVQSKDLQLPLIKRIKFYMENNGVIPRLPDKTAQLVITTGLLALGRSHELTKLNTFMTEMAPVQDAFQAILNVRNYADRVARATDVDIKGLLISEEDEQAAKEQAQQAEMMTNMMTSSAAVPVAKGLMDSPAVKDQIEGQFAPTPQ